MAIQSGGFFQQRLNGLAGQQWSSARMAQQRGKNNPRQESLKDGAHSAKSVQSAKNSPLLMASQSKIDDRDIVYSDQFRGGDSIRCFLWWLDRQDLLEFRDLWKGNDETNQYWSVAPDRRPTYPHLMRNGYYNGYFLPVDFEYALKVEAYKIAGWYPASRTACSTLRALREIVEISKRIELPTGYQFDQTDPFAGPRAAFDQLREMLLLSAHRNLPVVFNE